MRVALVNDYELVVVGVAALLEPYRDRVEVVELDSSLPVLHDVDVILYDTFGQVQGKGVDVDSLVNGGSAKVVIYSWNLHRPAGGRLDHGRGGGLPLERGRGPGAGARAIERIHAGETLVPSGGGRPTPGPRATRPARTTGSPLVRRRSSP